MAGAFALYKLEFNNGQPNIPLILNLLTEVCGPGNFNWSFQADSPPHIFAVEYPSAISSTLIDQCLNGHDPIATTAPPVIVGGGTSLLAPVGLVTNQTNSALRTALASNADGTPLIDQRFGAGDPYDPANPFSGTWIVYPAVEYPVGSGLSYNILEISANNLNTAINATSGLTFQQGTGSQNKISWYARTPTSLAADIYSYISGSTPNRSASAVLEAMPESGGSGSSLVALIAWASDLFNSTQIQINSVVSEPFTFRTAQGDAGVLEFGDIGSLVNFSNSAAETDIYRRTIKANTLGSNGRIYFHAETEVTNVTGLAKTVVHRLYLGTSVPFAITSGTINTGTTMGFTLDGIVQNITASSQLCIIRYYETAAYTASLAAATVKNSRVSTTEATASDKDIAITAQLSAASASLQMYGQARTDGPYYA